LAIFGQNREKAGFCGVYPKKALFWAFWAPSREGFTSTPRTPPQGEGGVPEGPPGVPRVPGARDPGSWSRPGPWPPRGLPRGSPGNPGNRVPEDPGPGGVPEPAPRGVDVKPPRRGPANPDFLAKLRIFLIFGLFPGFCPGSYRAKISENRENWPFLAKITKKPVFAGYTPKRPFFGLFGTPPARVLHQPLEPLPRGREGSRRALPGSPGVPGARDPGSWPGQVPALLGPPRGSPGDPGNRVPEDPGPGGVPEPASEGLM